MDLDDDHIWRGALIDWCIGMGLMCGGMFLIVAVLV